MGGRIAIIYAPKAGHSNHKAIRADMAGFVGDSAADRLWSLEDLYDAVPR
jgi:hypothetical protein